MDEPTSDLPPELAVAALPRWRQAVPEPGPTDEEECEAGSGLDWARGSDGGLIGPVGRVPASGYSGAIHAIFCGLGARLSVEVGDVYLAAEATTFLWFLSPEALK